MKICTKCKEEKDIEKFSWRNKSLGKLQFICKKCQNIKSKSHYSNNLEKCKARVSIYNLSKRKEAQIFLINFLIENPCVDCGEKDIICLEFDHLKDKKMSISTMVSNGNSIPSIKDEIAKCEVRCSNCHKKITAKRGNYYKYVHLATV